MQEAGLIGHWACGPGVGTSWPDRSGNGNHGSLVGSPTWALGGPRDDRPCIQLAAGSDLIQCGSPTLFDDLGAMSILAWLRTTNTAAEQQIVSKITSGLTAGWVFVLDAGGTIDFFQFGSVINAHVVSNETVSTNTWTHVAITRTALSGTYALYRNGTVCTYSSNDPGNTLTSDAAANLTIAGREGDSAGLIGKIDNVQLYNRTLSAAEILARSDPTYFYCVEYPAKGGSYRPAPFSPTPLGR